MNSQRGAPSLDRLPRLKSRERARQLRRHYLPQSSHGHLTHVTNQEPTRQWMGHLSSTQGRRATPCRKCSQINKGRRGTASCGPWASARSHGIRPAESRQRVTTITHISVSQAFARGDDHSPPCQWMMKQEDQHGSKQEQTSPGVNGRCHGNGNKGEYMEDASKIPAKNLWNHPYEKKEKRGWMLVS